MSDLQTALLAIGVGVVVAVYLFGWWQQRRFSRKFGAAFKASHSDALYQDTSTQPSEFFRKSVSTAENKLDEPSYLPEATGDKNFSMEPAEPAKLDESCDSVSERSDFIIEMNLAEPSPASVLVGLWQRKFDFGKPVLVCGLPLNSQQWERAIPEHHNLYARFRIALQLVDRGGAISAAKLADFRDLVIGLASHIKADAGVSDHNKAHLHAIELDAFCAEVDQMVGINLLPPGERLIPGANLAQIAALLNLKLESDGAFHLYDVNGHTLFSLINQDSRPFQAHTLETVSTAGITLLLDAPQVETPSVQFDKMVRVAHELAKVLQLNIVDDHRVVLSEGGLARIREQLVEIEDKMHRYGIISGSVQARRLFA